MTENEGLIPPGFEREILKNFMTLNVSQELLEDSVIPDLHEFLADPEAYRLKHPWTPPSRRARVKTWIGAKREKLGEKLYTFIVGTPFPDDYYDDW